MSAHSLRVGLPIVVFILVVLCWDLLVRAFAIPPYVLPSPGLVLATLIADAGLLWRSLLVTLTLTFEGFLLAAVGGILLAIAFNQWRLVDYSFYPYAVILQVTPIVAIAPLLLIYLPQPLAVLVCAWIVAFFPVLANTTLGLNSVDHNLLALFELYKASRWQVLWNLKLPSALPQMLTGLRIAGGLSLIGAVVAEIAAGSAGACSPHCFCCLSPALRFSLLYRQFRTLHCGAGTRARSIASAKRQEQAARARPARPSRPPPRSGCGAARTPVAPR